MHENSVKLLANYLTNRKQRVKVGFATSDWRPLVKGVPQGSVSGSTLFNLLVEGKPVHGFFFEDKRGQKLTRTLLQSPKLGGHYY